MKTDIRKHKSIKNIATLDELYSEEKQVLIHMESGTVYALIMKGNEPEPKTDCKILNLSNNTFFRTPNGENDKKYTSTKSLQLACKIVIESRIKDYIIGYSLNNI